MEGVKRVADIVQNLKSFAREDSLERRPHDINEGIEAMIKMVWNELKYRCTVERNLGQVPVVQCHAGQVNQVIMNVLVNASHAMPEGEAPSPSARRWSAGSWRFPSPTTARASRRRTCPASSTPSSRPRTWARARASVFRSATGSSRITAAGSRSTARSGSAPPAGSPTRPWPEKGTRSSSGSPPSFRPSSSAPRAAPLPPLAQDARSAIKGICHPSPLAGAGFHVSPTEGQPT